MKRAIGSSQDTRSIKKARTVKKSRKVSGTPEMYAPAQVFPDVMKTTLRYNSNMVAIDVSAASVYYSFYLNGMFDFDVDNILGNKQPLYYDQLFSADGPYKNYKVTGWKTTVTVINDSVDPLLVYWAQADIVADADTLLEVQNRPNVRELILTQRDGDKNSGTIVASGKIEDIQGSIRDPSTLSGGFNGNPTVPCYGNVFFYNPGGTVSTPVNAWLKITHDFYAECARADAIVS